MVMQETSSENCTLICEPLQSLQEFEIDNTKKYAQLILNFFWVVYNAALFLKGLIGWHSLKMSTAGIYERTVKNEKK